MRCVYSKNKSVTSHIKTQPIIPDSEISVKRASLIVAPINVTSKKSNSSIKNKIQLSNHKTHNLNKLTMTQPIKINKLTEDEQIPKYSKLTEKPSIINLLYEDDQQLSNEKTLNEVRYQESTRQSIKSSYGKMVTQSNFENAVGHQKQYGHGIAITKRVKHLLDQVENEQSKNLKRSSKLRVTVRKQF